MTSTYSKQRLPALTIKKLELDPMPPRKFSGKDAHSNKSFKIYVAGYGPNGEFLIQGSLKVNLDEPQEEQDIRKTAAFYLYPAELVEKLSISSIRFLELPTRREVELSKLRQGSIITLKLISLSNGQVNHQSKQLNNQIIESSQRQHQPQHQRHDQSPYISNKRNQPYLVWISVFGLVIYLFKKNVLLSSLKFVSFMETYMETYMKTYMKTYMETYGVYWMSSFVIFIGLSAHVFVQKRKSHFESLSESEQVRLAAHSSKKVARTATIDFPLSPPPAITLLPGVPLDVRKLMEGYSSSVSELDPHQQEGKNLWDQPLGNDFFIRGDTYLEDRVKVPSEDIAYKMVGLDFLLSTDKVRHISLMHKKSLVKTFAAVPVEERPYLLVINFILPFGNFVGYFTPGNATPYVGDKKMDLLLHQFFEGTDEFRNSRLKLIPKVVDGAWVVKKAVGTTPAIIGKKIPMSYYKGQSYFEIDIDICQNTIAKSICNLVKSQVQALIIDLAFVIEGTAREELPERLLAALRFIHLDPEKAPQLEIEQELVN